MFNKNNSRFALQHGAETSGESGRPIRIECLKFQVEGELNDHGCKEDN